MTGFESDYNIFYCEAGTPIFNYLGTQKHLHNGRHWDMILHSVVINPNFKILLILFLPPGLIMGLIWSAMANRIICVSNLDCWLCSCNCESEWHMAGWSTYIHSQSGNTCINYHCNRSRWFHHHNH